MMIDALGPDMQDLAWQNLLDADKGARASHQVRIEQFVFDDRPVDRIGTTGERLDERQVGRDHQFAAPAPVVAGAARGRIAIDTHRIRSLDAGPGHESAPPRFDRFEKGSGCGVGIDDPYERGSARYARKGRPHYVNVCRNAADALGRTCREQGVSARDGTGRQA